MSSRFPGSALGGALALAAAALAAGCPPRQAEQSGGAPGGQASPPIVRDRTGAPFADAAGAAYDGDPAQIAAGQRYFGWYNCVGCHFHGAGGIGPAFLDRKWIYGDGIGQIHASIRDGRPNGMPAWGDRIPDEQIWQIAAYVRSLPTDRPVPTTPTPPAADSPDALRAKPRTVRMAEP